MGKDWGINSRNSPFLVKIGKPDASIKSMI
jgi:hypothetical protein